MVWHRGSKEAGVVRKCPRKAYSLMSLGMRTKGYVRPSPIYCELTVTNWHFSCSFHFYFYHIDTLYNSSKSLSPQQNSLLVIHFVFSLCFRPSRKIKSACIQSHNVANTMLKTTADGPLQGRTEQQRLSNCPGERQDQKPPPGSANRRDRSSAN